MKGELSQQKIKWAGGSRELRGETILKERRKVARKYLFKICSLSLESIKRQIETALRFHFTLVRMSKVNKTTDSKCWGGCGEREPSVTFHRIL